ncbi:MAG: GDP-mannose 4,6-dehydratase [Thermoplasmata archaeon]
MVAPEHEYRPFGRTALVTGITGQDGSFLAELLLGKGYRVFGLVRRLSAPNRANLDALRGRAMVVDGDLLDQSSLDNAVRISEPDEVYNLASQSFVGTSWQQPVLTSEVTGLGALRMLEAVRRFGKNGVRFYQAGSSEMFGNAPAPQDEGTPFRPRSPYGSGKLFAHNTTVNYRESYGLFASNGILFNHESERRGEEFVTRKVSMWAASWAAHKPYRLQLGNLDAKRDWGYAPDYVDLMWRILRHDRADDFVGATGETHAVRDFVERAEDAIGALPVAVGHYLESYVPELVRPAEVNELRGDASRAKRELGWEPTVRFPELVRRMVAADYARIAGRPPLLDAARTQL